MENCGKCNEQLSSDGNYVTCRHCSNSYHFDCSIMESTYRGMGKTRKNKWKCTNCRPVQQPEREESEEVLTGIDEIKAILSDVQMRLTQNTVQLVETNKSQEFISSKYDDLLKVHLETQNYVKSLEASINNLIEKNKEKDALINNLTDRLSKLEYEKCEKGLEIIGLEQNENENLMEIVKTIGENLNVNIAAADIKRITRAKRRNAERIPPIQVKFYKRN